MSEPLKPCPFCGGKAKIHMEHKRIGLTLWGRGEKLSLIHIESCIRDSWIPDPRPPFKIWVKPEQIAPFFLVPHHPYAISLLLKISDGFRTEEFRRLGLTGSSEDWERLVRGVIQEFEENNSGMDLFHFDSDKDVFCVYSQYIDDLMLLSKMIRAACDDEKKMRTYLGMIEYIKLFWEDTPEGEPSVILYEVDTGNERLALRSIDIFMNGHTRNLSLIHIWP